MLFTFFDLLRSKVQQYFFMTLLSYLLFHFCFLVVIYQLKETKNKKPLQLTSGLSFKLLPTLLRCLKSVLRLLVLNSISSFIAQDIRRELDLVLEQKIAQPNMNLYCPLDKTPPPCSKLIQTIIELITSEDYSDQNDRIARGKHLYYRK